TVAVPERPPLVAVTVLANVPITVPATNKPELLIVPPPAATDHTGVRATTLPLASLPMAVNCCVRLTFSETGFGVTVIVASAPTATFTVAKPEMPPLVACTVLVYVPDTVPAVKRPVPLLMLPAVAFTTDQMGVNWTMLPTASLPTAVKVCRPPVARLLGFGLTVIDASGPAITVTVAVPEIAPLVAVTVLVK